MGSLLCSVITKAAEPKAYHPSENDCQIEVISPNGNAEVAVKNYGWTIKNYDQLCEKFNKAQAAIYIVGVEDQLGDLKISNGFYTLVNTYFIKNAVIVPSGNFETYLEGTIDKNYVEGSNKLTHTKVMDIVKALTDEDFKNLANATQKFLEAKPDLNAKIAPGPKGECVLENIIQLSPLKDLNEKYGFEPAKSESFCKQLADWNLQQHINSQIFESSDFTVVMTFGYFMPKEYENTGIKVYVPYVNGQSVLLKETYESDSLKVDRAVYHQGQTVSSKITGEMGEAVYFFKKTLGLNQAER